MRILLPERIPLTWLTVVVLAFAGVQLVQKTDYRFVFLHVVFMVTWGFAFNLAGGFTRASGAYIFWFGILTIPGGTVVKALIGEPADSNMWNSLLLMTVYTVSMFVMILAVFATRKVTANVISIAGRLKAYNLDYRNASIGCSVLGLAIYASGYVLPATTGSIFTALRQINGFIEIGIILGTIFVVESSKGKRSWSYLNGVPAVLLMLIGLSTFTKQGMYTPCVCWVIGLAYSQFRMKLWHIAGLVVFGVFAIMVLAPIAQVGRNEVAGTGYIDDFKVAWNLLTNIATTRQLYNDVAIGARESGNFYFGKDVGMVARFNRIESDDPLIFYSSRGHYAGYAGVSYAFLNWFPHVLLPNKDKYRPEEMGGNSYAREMGMLPSSDTTTGISFGAPSEAFHVDGWTGVIVLQPLVWSLLFISVDLMCGDVRRSPWGLIVGLAFAHVAPEAGIIGAIGYTWIGNVGVFCAMLFTTYGATVIGAMFTTTMVRQAAPLGADPTRAASLAAATRS